MSDNKKGPHTSLLHSLFLPAFILNEVRSTTKKALTSR